MDETIDVLIEIPRGSRNKYEVDHHTGRIRLDRRLFAATTYPTEYGFIPDTLAEDGDPLDVLVLTEDPTFPGCWIHARPVGVMWMEDEAGPDAKVICVEPNEPRWRQVQDVSDLPDEIPRRDQALLRHLQGPRAREVLGHRGVRGVRLGVEGDPRLLRAGQGERAPRPVTGAGRVDVVVVGAGIVGLATARALLLERPGLDLVVLEREEVAAHQSGHNSGVIHSGLYYKPGSAKARLCTAGRTEVEQYCTTRGIPWERCGKVVVASVPEEVPALAALAERGRRNGLEIEELSAAGLAEHEPHAVGLASIFVPATGVVDYRAVCDQLAREVAERGGRVLTGVGVESAIDAGSSVVVRSDAGLWWADRVVTCAGAWSDVLADASGERPRARIIPFRGEYLELRPEASHLVNHLIYPVPDPQFPFLGVHFTKGVDGHVHAGPNAVPALGRDAYRWSRVRPRDTASFALRRSTWKLAARHWRTGVDEIVRSVVPSRMVAALQRLVPEVTGRDLVPAGSGVRAQAIDADGALLDDFEIVRRGRCVHVVNAPSPAATASLAIGSWIAREVDAAVPEAPAPGGR